MASDKPQRGILLQLAAEGLVPVLGGCAGLLAGGGPEAGLAGAAVGQALEKAINFFGGRIVERWCAWFKGQSPEARAAAVADLAALSPQQARQEAGAALSRLAPDARPEDVSLALEYLTAIPRTFDRALVRDTATGLYALPPTVSLDEPQQLLQMLPTDVPPYPVPSELPGSPYLLEDLLGSGGFGAVYRATTRSLQHLPLAIKFCLDPSLTAALHRERSNLERLMKVGGQSWSPRIVRLYGYDLEHRTPYLVYEYVSGGDLTHQLNRLRQRLGRGLNADEVLGLMAQVTEGLSFAHRHGLVHRDLKPANVLVDGETLKLADFGLGGVTAARAAQVSRIGATTVDYLTVSERASLFRGAGTPLYMSPEQRRGAPPDPRQDLYSLGVMWFQLLVGDVTRELHPGWAKELAVKHGVPPAHLDLIGRCVGWIEERPRDAGELLPLVQALRGGAPSTAPVAKAAPPKAPPEESRPAQMASLVRQLHEGLSESARLEHNRRGPLIGTLLIGLLIILFFLGISRGSGFSLLVSGPLVVGLYWLLHWHRDRMGQEARKQVETAVAGLTDGFPDAVRQWGGPGALRSPGKVTEIARGLGIEVTLPEVAAPPPLPPGGRASVSAAPVDPGQQEGLRDKLRPLAEAHATAAAPGERRFLPWWAALVLSFLFLGAPIGVVTGYLYSETFSPLQGRSEYGRTTYHDSRGYDISDVEYDLTRRSVPLKAGLLGAVAGAVLTGLATWVLTWWRTYRRLLVLALLGSAIVPGVPAAIGAYFLFTGPFGPVAYYKEGRTGYYDYRGNELTWVDYALTDRHTAARGVLVAAGTGLALVLGLTALLLWRRSRLQARAQQAVRDHAQEVLTAFPAVVQAWGGPARLHDPAFVRQALADLEVARRPDGPSPAGARAAIPAPVEPGQRDAFLDELRPLGAAHAAAAACGPRSSFPLGPALVLSVLFLGAPAGVLVGVLYNEHFSPISSSYPHPLARYNYRGSPITEVEHDLARRSVKVTAGLLGAATGLVLTGLGTWVLTWWRTYRRLLVLALLGSIIVPGGPAGIGAYFLFEGLFGPIEHYKEGHTRYYDYRFNELSWEDFTVNERQNVVNGTLVAAGTGLALVLSLTAFLLWRRGRLQARVQKAVRDHAQELLTAFPAVVQAWGGPARLHDPTFVQQALAGLEAGSR